MSSIHGWKRRKVKPTEDGGMPRVSLVVASYLNDDRRRLDSLLCLLYSVRAQTYPHWEVVVVHDGPIVSPTVKADLNRVCQGPTWLVETTERKGSFGHPNRHLGIRHVSGDYVGLSNDDNYYAPVYFEWMLSELQEKKAQLAYCNMAHSHRGWGVIDAKPARGFIDAGNWIAESGLAKGVPWTDMTFAGDWTYFDALHRKARKAVKVPGVLFVHN